MQNLRRGRLGLRIEGEEINVLGVGSYGRAGLGHEPEEKMVALPPGRDRVHRGRLRELGEGGGDDGLPVRIGGRGSGLDGQGEAEIRAAGQADLRAFEPVYFRGEGDGRTGRKIRGRGDLYGQEHFALVAVVCDGFVEREKLGRGPLDGAGGPAGREAPGDLGGHAGVAGVDPVSVPAGVGFKTEGGPERLAGGDGGDIGHQFSLGMGRAHDRGRGQRAGGEGREHEGGGAEDEGTAGQGRHGLVAGADETTGQGN